jgi:predicted DNA-binding transcriptional regulator AlpA
MAVVMNKVPSNGPLSDDYYTRQQLADELGTSVRTLDRWHAHRQGPPRVAVGKLVLYRREAVREWLQAREVQPLATE